MRDYAQIHKWTAQQESEWTKLWIILTLRWNALNYCVLTLRSFAFLLKHHHNCVYTQCFTFISQTHYWKLVSNLLHSAKSSFKRKMNKKHVPIFFFLDKNSFCQVRKGSNPKHFFYYMRCCEIAPFFSSKRLRLYGHEIPGFVWVFKVSHFHVCTCKHILFSES